MITVVLLDTGFDPRALVPGRWAWTDRSGRLLEDDSPRDPATDVDLWQPFDALFDKHDRGWAGIER